MDPKLLPRAGIIQNPRKDYLCSSAHLNSISGQNVLCVGYREAEIEEYIVPHRPAAITLLNLWRDHPDGTATKFPLITGDLTKRVDLPDGQFDAVLTLSLLEHLTRLSRGIEEIHRVLKPRGYLYAFFGPTWSSAYGHHIYERAGDPLFDFSVWQMPAHLHLLCSPSEIIRFYVDNGYGEIGGRTALHWFYDADHINRLMYEDYLDILAQRFQFILQESMYTPLPLEHIALLRSKYPRYKDFTTYGGKFILQALGA